MIPRGYINHINRFEKEKKTGSFHSTDIKRANDARNEEKTVDKSIRDASDVFVGEGDVVALV